MKEIPDGSVDMVLCDLPYGMTKCKWDKAIPLEPMWEQINRLIKPDGAICLFGSEPFSSTVRLSNIQSYKYDWVWEKERPSNIFQLKKQAGKVHEMISVFYRRQATYNPIMEKAVQPNNNGGRSKSQQGYMNALETCGNKRTKISENYNPAVRYPRSVLKFNRGTRKNGLHPTQKPVALLEYLIKTYTYEGETVLDFTMGSGSTGVACANTGRRFIGIELDERFFQIAKDRVERAYGKEVISHE